jgi:hypothetical protein
VSQYFIASKYFDIASIVRKQEITDFSTQRVSFFNTIQKDQNEVQGVLNNFALWVKEKYTANIELERLQNRHFRREMHEMAQNGAK